MSLRSEMAEAQALVQALLGDILPSVAPEDGRLSAAMRYAVMAGGKRLRPFLTMAVADMYDVPRRQSARVGCAIELVHTYSLVHDDLPCMDDDALRRGKPTVHIAFDEATAVLVGDALQALAFELLCGSELTADPELRLQLVRGLARAGGAQGMCGGQMMDLAAETETFDQAKIQRLQAMKTGALLCFSCEAGALLGRAPEDEYRAVVAFGRELGAAFQIADDLLDLDGDAAELGKATGKDAGLGKATLPGLLGPAAAAEMAGDHIHNATLELDLFGERAMLLRQVASFVIDRRQ